MEIIDEELTKKEILVELKKQPLPKTGAEKGARVVGHVVIGLAMTPPGLFGFLLTDYLLGKLGWSILERIIVDLLVGIAAEEGKRQVVSYVGLESFEKFVRLKWWKELLADCLKYPYKFATESLNLILSFLPASVYAYITTLAFDNIAILLRIYKKKILSDIAAVIEHKYIKAPFLIASLTANWMSFPVIHQSALKTIGNGIYELALEHPNLAAKRKAMTNVIESYRLALKELVTVQLKNNKDLLDIKERISIWGLEHAIQDRNLAELRETLITKGGLENYLPTELSYWEWGLKHTTGYGMFGVASWGLTNIYYLGQKAAQFYGVATEWLQKCWGGSAYGSMVLLTIFFVYPFGKSLIDFCFNRTRRINIFSQKRQAWIYSLCILCCLLGSSPNTYQALLTGAGIPSLVVAFLAQFFIEVYGFYLLTTAFNTNRVAKDNEGLRWISEVDSLLLEAANLTNVPYEALKELARKLPQPKEEEKNLDNISDTEDLSITINAKEEEKGNYLPHYRTWVTKIYGCFFQEKPEQKPLLSKKLNNTLLSVNSKNQKKIPKKQCILC